MSKPPHRIIWAFAFGYFAFYIPYSATVKLITTGAHRANGIALLPVSLLTTVATMLLIVTLLGWWKDVSRPSRAVVVSGIGTALIIATTTLAYTFSGISVVLALLLMRGGVLTLAPIVDTLLGRHVRWFSWAALLASLAAVGTAIFRTSDHGVTGWALLNLGGYLFGYMLRLPCMTHVAKVDDPAATRRYFVNEMLVACALLVAVPALLAIGGIRPLRDGYLDYSAGTMLIGIFYACLYLFGTLIYLDRRENTFCIPLNRASSLLAGVASSFILAAVWNFPPVPASQLIGVGLMLLALLFLSPVHHLGEYVRGRALETPPLRHPERIDDVTGVA